MLIRIDLQAGEAVYDQIASALGAQIASGELAVGERLPAARDVADALGINMHTVLHAYQTLRDQGLIELRRGRGAVVTAHGAEHYAPLLDALRLVRREAIALGLPLSAVAAMIDSEESSP